MYSTEKYTGITTTEKATARAKNALHHAARFVGNAAISVTEQVTGWFARSNKIHVDSLSDQNLRDLGLDPRQRIEQDPRAAANPGFMGPM